MSKIKISVAGKEAEFTRPSFIHPRNADRQCPSMAHEQLEMLESIRNCLEEIGRQACGIAVGYEIQQLRKAVQRMDLRLAQTQKLKGGRVSQ